MRRISLLGFAMALALLSSTYAVEEIPTSDPLRKQLFDSIRPRAQKLVEGVFAFQGSLRREGDWAVFTGELVRKNSAPIPIGDNESSDVFALWQNVAGKWKVIDFSGGHTDVFYVDYPEKYGFPKRLIFGR